MMNKWRVAAIAIVALLLGFVGGVWFFGSGLGFQLISPPKVDPPEMTAAEKAAVAGATAAATARKAPTVKAVGLPEEANFSGGSGGLGPTAERVDLLPSPRCSWVIEPRPFRLGSSWHMTNRERAIGGGSALDPTSGGLHYLLVQSTRHNGPVIELRPVFFDADANRFVPSGGARSSSKSNDGMFVVSQFRFPPNRELKPDKIAYFGIELVVAVSARELVEAARKEAEEKGVEIPPAPVLGRPYPFDLRAIDGQRIRAADFRGKAVLLVVSAPARYGSGAMAMSRAKRIRDSAKADELAIVGISFDGSAADARTAFEKSGADGPVVLVPNDSQSRRLWRDGAQLAQVPTFFLLDREGVLRFVCNTFNVEDNVNIVLGRPRHPVHHVFVKHKTAPKTAGAPTSGPQTAPKPEPRP